MVPTRLLENVRQEHFELVNSCKLDSTLSGRRKAMSSIEGLLTKYVS